MTSPLPFRFHPPWWAVAFAAAGCVAGVLLGNWQSDRAAAKRAAAAAARQVVLRGELVPRYTVLLENKFNRGRTGYHVVQPLRVAGIDRHVLVNRGWIAATEDRAKPPVARTPSGEVTLQGAALDHFPRAYAIGTGPGRTQPFVWQNVSIAEFSRWSGLKLEPYVMEQHSALDDDLVRDWPRPDAGIEKHEAYALQWYSLAVLSVAVLIALNLKRAKR